MERVAVVYLTLPVYASRVVRVPSSLAIDRLSSTNTKRQVTRVDDSTTASVNGTGHPLTATRSETLIYRSCVENACVCGQRSR